MTTQEQLNPLAPLEPYLADPEVTEILVDGHERVYLERRGQLEDVPSLFRDEQHLLEVINAIFEPIGRRLNESHPIGDARLVDGTHVNAVIPPIALSGPTLTLRKFAKDQLTVADLIRFGSATQEMFDFIRACVKARLNIVVAGGTGSGKTTVLNTIVSMIPPIERLIVVERVAELQLAPEFKRFVSLESRPANLEGKGEISVDTLVQNALKMRPDRIISGEVLGPEILSLLQAMNTGHDGCMMTVHASGPRNALSRMETMAAYADVSIPVLAVREMMASAFDVIVSHERLRDGKRKMLKITEVVGMQGDVIELQDIFEFRQTGMSEGKMTGHFTPTGYIPRFLDRIHAVGVELPLSFFTPR